MLKTVVRFQNQRKSNKNEKKTKQKKNTKKQCQELEQEK